MNNKELLPCPFCGGEAESIDFFPRFFVKCKNCGANTGFHLNISNAIEAWNERNPSEKPNSSSQIPEVVETGNCKYLPKLTRSDIKKMFKPLQWEELEKRTTYEDGFTEVYRSAESNLFFGMLKFHIFKYHNEFKELRLLDSFKGQSISIKSENCSLEEAKQYARNWLVNLICSALGVEE